MKKIIPLLFLTFLAIQTSAQKKLFVRVFDNNGKHMAKGNIVNTTDSSLLIKIKKDTVELFLNEFGTLKTKRSAGNNVIIGTFVGAGLFAIIGAASSDPDAFLGDTPASGAALGAGAGLIYGAAAGGLSALFKNSKTFIINGNKSRWTAFSSWYIEKYKQ